MNFFMLFAHIDLFLILKHPSNLKMMNNEVSSWILQLHRTLFRKTKTYFKEDLLYRGVSVNGFPRSRPKSESCFGA